MDSLKRQDNLTKADGQAQATLFGAFRLAALDGDEIPISNRRARALLAMLCLAPDESIDRDYLSKLLWPGRFEAQARASLRQCLLDLGKVLASANCDLLNISRSRIGLRDGTVRTDLSDLQHCLTEGNYLEAAERLVSIGAKPLLDQMDFGQAFDDWLSVHRHQAEQRLQSAITTALSALEKRDDLANHARLLSAWSLRSPAPNPISGRKKGKVRIAVLPFKSIAEPDDQGFFADGIVDELITTFGQVPQLLVAGRTSSFQFKKSDKSPSDIASALNVSYLLEGSVQRHGEQVRIDVGLIDAETGFESWSYSYDGTLDDIFAARADVAQAVTNGLSEALNLQEHEPKTRTLTTNREAYGLYLQGRALTIRAIGDGVLPTAIELLEKALALDPEFAECWTALAEAEINVTVYSPCLDRLERSEKAAGYAKKALSLSPQQAHARIVLAFYAWTQNDIVGALDLAFEAYRLEPNNPDVLNRVGSFLLYCGLCREALPYIDASIDQDPVNGRSYAMLSGVHLNLGNIDAAIDAGQRMVDLGFPSMWLAAATAIAGDNELAVEQYQLTKKLMNTVIYPPAGSAPMEPEAMDAYWLMAAKGLWSENDQDRKNYCMVLEMLHATLHDPCDSTIVIPAIWMGEAQMVFKTLGKQITPANFFAFMSLWTDAEPINQVRLHPDFMDFAQRIGMVDAWEKYGWPDLLPKPLTIK
ncbi:tetratricopeptide repeat protein [Sphingorhabdus sp. Alg231-15]|uniref:tetratricopeptide repeat protein n=1 Tax=Sphingorhabdus sp. Alg231-15 TaxID=1922222 RepID=UPI000D5553D2